MSPLSTTGRTRGEGEHDEMVQLNQIERLVQITEGPLDERLDLPRGAAAALHHEDWRRHAEIADALHEIEAGGLCTCQSSITGKTMSSRIRSNCACNSRMKASLAKLAVVSSYV